MRGSPRRASLNSYEIVECYDNHPETSMPRDIEIAHCIAAAEERIGAMEVLLEMAVGQLKGERRQIEELKAAVASPVSSHEGSGPVAPAVISPEMLAG